MLKKSYNRKSPGLWISQNYLTSGKLLDMIISRTSITKGDRVLEIGPGKGHITRALLRIGAEVTAVELDPALVAALKAKLGSQPGLRLIQADIITWRLPTQGAYKVFSNIPFHHTSAILRKLTQTFNPPKEAWLVMEYGAAKRFLGKPRESMGSLLLKPRYELRIVHRFSRDDFHPKPSVDSVLLHIKLKIKPDITLKDWLSYTNFLNSAFAWRLKKQLTKSRLRLRLGIMGLRIVAQGTFVCSVAVSFSMLANLCKT